MAQPQKTELRRENLFPMILVCTRYGHRQDLPDSPPSDGGETRCRECGAPTEVRYQNGEPIE
jgi:hypothetical protein